GRRGGARVAVGDIPAPTTFSGAAEVTASRNGVIAFNTRIVRDTRLAWFDLQGHETAGVPLPAGPYLGHALSPDGRRAIVNRESSDGSSDLWMVDLAGGAAIRLTDGVGRCGGPCWGPDGREIAYTWEDNTPQRIVVMSTENGARRTLLAGDRAFKRLDSWSGDGRYLVFERGDPVMKWDLWVLPTEGDTIPKPCVRSAANDQNGILSPDGRWLSYQSNESGAYDVYVQSFPVAGLKYRVTPGGGNNLGWSPDGKRLYFGRDDAPYVGFGADVIPGREFALGPARPVARVAENVRSTQLARDGKRLLCLV